LASLNPTFKCGLRFRVVVGILLHATTPEARASLVKILGPVDFAVWLVVLDNPEVDYLILVPASDLVDAASGDGAEEAEFAKFATPKGTTSRSTAWVKKMSELPSVKRTAPTLESKFGPHHLRTLKAYLLSETERKKAVAKKAAARALSARREQREEAASARAAAREEKAAALEDARAARQQVALTQT
jgi:hypothetical protein